jgi:CheY-like chemotaxis protein
MPSPDEFAWMAVALQEMDKLLRGISDYRQYPDLLNRTDARLDSLLEHIVTSVRDARLLTSKLQSRVDDLRAEAVEEARQASEARTKGAPAAPEPPAAPRIVRPPANIEQILMANPTGMRELVLVADHDRNSLEEIEQMLTGEDYRVLSVRDAFEAISIYARLWAGVDLVILDFTMPGLSGDLIFEELKAINPQVAAVVSTGFTQSAKLSQMLGQGLKGFLPKPFEKEKFLRQVAQVLAHRPSTRPT